MGGGCYKAANGNYKWLKASECIEYEKRAVVVNEACIAKKKSSPMTLSYASNSRRTNEGYNYCGGQEDRV